MYHLIKAKIATEVPSAFSSQQAAAAVLQDFLYENYRSQWQTKVPDLLERLEIYLGVRVASKDDVQAANRMIALSGTPVRRLMEAIPHTEAPPREAPGGRGDPLDWNRDYGMPEVDNT